MTPIYDMENGAWSELQKECYERNCVCRGCFYQCYNNGLCGVKQSLIDKIKVFGLKGEVQTKQWLQE